MTTCFLVFISNCILKWLVCIYNIRAPVTFFCCLPCIVAILSGFHLQLVDIKKVSFWKIVTNIKRHFHQKYIFRETRIIFLLILPCTNSWTLLLICIIWFPSVHCVQCTYSVYSVYLGFNFRLFSSNF